MMPDFGSASVISTFFIHLCFFALKSSLIIAVLNKYSGTGTGPEGLHHLFFSPQKSYCNELILKSHFKVQ